MSLAERKQKVLTKIAATKTLTESKINAKLQKASPYINQAKSVIAFLTDLIKVLIGYGALIKVIIDALIHSVDNIELEIKKTLKLEAKNVVSCGINPSLPDFLKSTGVGIVIEVKKIDFYDMLKTDPNSASGKLLYSDVTPTLFDSTDFNTFLYAVIQDEGVTHTWQNIFDITFYSVDPKNAYPNNSLIIKANKSYDNKPLNDLINNYIDSIKLFNTESLTNKIIDSIYGSVSINLNKTKKQLESEAKINAIIDKIIDTDSTETIDDSYFEFDNQELSELEYHVDNKQRGVIKINTSDQIEASIDQSRLTNFNAEMSNFVSIQDKKDVLTKHLDLMAEDNTTNSTNSSDNANIKLNFIQNMINNLGKSIINILLSPKVVILFLIIFKIVYGEKFTFNDGVDFVKKNKRLYKGIITTITTIISALLLKLVLKYIAKLMAEEQVQRAIEKAQYRKDQYQTLVGVSQDSLDKIKSINNII